MTTFDPNGWMSVLPIVYPKEEVTDPLEGPFNTMTKIKKALDALNVMNLDEIEFRDVALIKSKCTEIYISLGNINPYILGTDDFKLVSQAGDKLKDILELQKGLAD